MDVWDGSSFVRDTSANRAPAGWDYAETIFQIQETQRAVNAGGGHDPQTAINTADIAANVIDIGINTGNIGTNTIAIGNNTTAIGNNTIAIGNNTIAIGNNTIAIGNNTTDISNLTITVGNNTTAIGNNTTAISNLSITVGTNTNNILTNATNISTNTNSIRTVLTNNEAAPVIKCTPVYIFNDSGFKAAKADSSITTRVIGLAYEDIVVSGDIQTVGVVTATAEEWDAVTGGVGGLIPNTLYYLSETDSGKLKANAPSTGYVAPIGIALSSTRLKIEILNIILL